MSVRTAMPVMAFLSLTSCGSSDTGRPAPRTSTHSVAATVDGISVTGTALITGRGLVKINELLYLIEELMVVGDGESASGSGEMRLITVHNRLTVALDLSSEANGATEHFHGFVSLPSIGSPIVVPEIALTGDLGTLFTLRLDPR